MKKLILTLLLIPLTFLVSCSNSGFDVISAKEGKEMMDNDSSIVLIDVREQSEYDEVHIANARLLPLGDIESRAESMFPDKTKTYILYCRSGNRSNEAAKLFVKLGYESVYDMGGIIDWPYLTVSG